MAFLIVFLLGLQYDFIKPADRSCWYRILVYTPAITDIANNITEKTNIVNLAKVEILFFLSAPVRQMVPRFLNLHNSANNLTELTLPFFQFVVTEKSATSKKFHYKKQGCSDNGKTYYSPSSVFLIFASREYPPLITIFRCRRSSGSST